MAFKKFSISFMALVMLVSSLVVSPVSAAETNNEKLTEQEFLAELERELKEIDPNIEILDVGELPEGTEFVEADKVQILDAMKQVILENELVENENPDYPILDPIEPPIETHATYRYDTFYRYGTWNPLEPKTQVRRVQYQYTGTKPKVSKVKNIKADYVGLTAYSYYHRYSTYSLNWNKNKINFKIYGDMVLGVVVKNIPIGLKFPQNWSYTTTPPWK